MTKGRNIPTERSIDDIIKSESVAVRRSDRREVRQNWNSDFQDYQLAMETGGANFHQRVLPGGAPLGRTEISVSIG